MSSLFQNASPFGPFFDVNVTVEGTRENARTVRATLRACVLDGGLADTFAEGATESNRRMLSVQFISEDCAAAGYVPRIGDSLTFEDGRKATVKDVARPCGWIYELESLQS